MTSRRILVTGLSTLWGGRLAQALERSPEVETIIGVDSEDPICELERTDFVRVTNQHSLLRRIVVAAAIDTVVDTRLSVDSLRMSMRETHENNSIGTLNILAACSGEESPVRKLVFKGSAHFYGCSRNDPAFFTEGMRRDPGPPTPLERSIIEADEAVEDFSHRNPGVVVTTLRFCDVLGPDLDSPQSRFLALPAVPMIAGFDPRWQFVDSDDVVRVLRFAVERDVAGAFNVAADGVLVTSEVISLLGKHALPVLSPWGTTIASSAVRLLGVRLPSELLSQLRYGRALDNRRLKAAGFEYGLTTRETVERFGEYLRLRSVLDRVEAPYRYEKEVEDFIRRSPAARGADEGGG